MKALIVVGILIGGLLLLWAASAHAADGCGQRELFRAALKQKYNEVPDKMAMVGPRAMIELFLSPQKSWTLTITDAAGRTCIIAAGFNWTDSPVEIEGKSL